MPSLPKRLCSQPGCTELVIRGRCAVHQAKTVQPRRKTVDRGYGVQHERLRVEAFIRDEFRCVDCGWEPPSVVALKSAGLDVALYADRILAELQALYRRHGRHLHGDHEIPIDVRPDLANDLRNYRTRCSHCHNRKTTREDGGFGNASRRRSDERAITERIEWAAPIIV